MKNFVLLTSAVAGGNQTLFMILARSAFLEAAEQVSDDHVCHTQLIGTAACSLEPHSEQVHTGLRCGIHVCVQHNKGTAVSIIANMLDDLRCPQIMQSQSTGRRLRAVLNGLDATLQQSGVSPATAAAISATIDTVNGFTGAAANTEAIEAVSYVTQAQVQPHLSIQLNKTLAAGCSDKVGPSVSGLLRTVHIRVRPPLTRADQ